MTKLRELRLKTKKTVKQVAEETGIAPNYLSEMETGKREISRNSLPILCEYYKVKPNELLGYDEMLVINEETTEFSEKDIKMLRCIKALSDEDFDKLQDYISFLIWMHKKRIEAYNDKERQQN